MDRLQCRDHFLDVFSKAAEQRKSRDKWVPDPLEGRNSLEWVIFERQTMLAEVNRLRAERGLDPVDEKRVLQVEQMACGHVDYARKFALYCAELADGVEEIQP